MLGGGLPAHRITRFSGSAGWVTALAGFAQLQFINRTQITIKPTSERML